jgi:predicted hydrolase (HD superfamily)
MISLGFQTANPKHTSVLRRREKPPLPDGKNVTVSFTIFITIFFFWRLAMTTELTPALASKILADHVTEPHLLTHALAVSAAMRQMGLHFQENPDLYEAVGILHDVDYQRFPTEHCRHVAELLSPMGISAEVIRAIESHGYGLVSQVKPETNLEKSLYTVDELTGIIQAAALMRPTRMEGMEVKSVMKKFKDKAFSAKCDREVIKAGCAMLGMELAQVMELCITGMKCKATELGLAAKE